VWFEGFVVEGLGLLSRPCASGTLSLLCHCCVTVVSLLCHCCVTVVSLSLLLLAVAAVTHKCTGPDPGRVRSAAADVHSYIAHCCCCCCHTNAQVRILEESGQLPLAYIAAASHGFEEEAGRLRDVSNSGQAGGVQQLC
jgi:hypothetical protein